MNAAVSAEEHAALSAAMHENAFDRCDRADAVDSDEFAALTDDHALANLDAFTDWLASHCMHQHAVSSTHVHYQARFNGQPFDLGAYQIKLDDATVPELQHTILECLDAQRVFLAVRELKARYLKAQVL